MADSTDTQSSRLCIQFGLNAERRQQRLALLGFAAIDHQLAEELSESVIKPCVDEIVDRFYTKLLSDPGAHTFISDEESLNHLKKMQRGYLLTLGKGFDSEGYFESRLRAGLAHAWVGLPLTTYQCGFHVQQHLILANIKKMLPEERFEPLLLFLLKIVSLDMSLAIEAYHDVQVEGLSRSIDRMKDRQRTLQDRVSTDSLTGVLSRSQILEELEGALRDAGAGDNGRLAIVMLDVDHFKPINDKYGHQAGDQVLTQVAHRIRAAIRGSDRVGRFGGEEFLVVLPNTDREVAIQVAERVRAHLSSTPVNSDKGLIDVKISGGIAMYASGADIKSLIEQADEALYQAKNSGRNRVVFYTGKP